MAKHTKPEAPLQRADRLIRELRSPGSKLGRHHLNRTRAYRLRIINGETLRLVAMPEQDRPADNPATVWTGLSRAQTV